uniref:Uncharacterized protein n=1 Tax=Chenopodium quinoa TaxID=63459 RepID=A0A803LTY2_CHEQI
MNSPCVHAFVPMASGYQNLLCAVFPLALSELRDPGERVMNYLNAAFYLSAAYYLAFLCKSTGLCRFEQGVGASTMALDNVISSPHRRTQGAFASSSPHKKFSHDVSFTTLIQRHRFLLVALVLLVVLCTVYLYFAVTMSSGESCSGLLGTERVLCLENHGKGTFTKGKLKLF